MLQTLFVALLVTLCAAHVLWRLVLPARLRRQVAAALLHLPLPGALARRVEAQSPNTNGCGCDGCDHRPVQPAANQVIRIVRQARQ